MPNVVLICRLFVMETCDMRAVTMPQKKGTRMTDTIDIVFVLYPGIVQLDFSGPHEVFSRLPGARIRLCSPDGGDLRASHGLVFRDIERLQDIERCDLLCIPGGPDQSRITEADCLNHIRRLAESARYVTSVCTGSLVLAAAGLLEGKRSACHWGARSQLEKFGAIPDSSRVVRDGRFITGSGVTSGIDFALTCAAEIAGPVIAQAIQLILEYAPEPPFNAGRPEFAAPEVKQALGQLS